MAFFGDEEAPGREDVYGGGVRAWVGQIEDVEAAGGGGVGFGCADVVAVDGCWGDEELVQIVEDERGGGEVFAEPCLVVAANRVAVVESGGMLVGQGARRGFGHWYLNHSSLVVGRVGCCAAWGEHLGTRDVR